MLLDITTKNQREKLIAFIRRPSKPAKIDKYAPTRVNTKWSPYKRQSLIRIFSDTSVDKGAVILSPFILPAAGA